MNYLQYIEYAKYSREIGILGVWKQIETEKAERTRRLHFGSLVWAGTYNKQIRICHCPQSRLSLSDAIRLNAKDNQLFVYKLRQFSVIANHFWLMAYTFGNCLRDVMSVSLFTIALFVQMCVIRRISRIVSCYDWQSPIFSLLQSPTMNRTK